MTQGWSKRCFHHFSYCLTLRSTSEVYLRIVSQIEGTSFRYLIDDLSPANHEWSFGSSILSEGLDVWQKNPNGRVFSTTQFCVYLCRLKDKEPSRFSQFGSSSSSFPDHQCSFTLLENSSVEKQCRLVHLAHSQGLLSHKCPGDIEQLCWTLL